MKKFCCVGKVHLLVVEDFDCLVPCLKAENDVSTWVTLYVCPNMDERCRYKKFQLCFILFVYRVGVIKIVIVINYNLTTFSKVISCNCN